MEEALLGCGPCLAIKRIHWGLMRIFVIFCLLVSTALLIGCSNARTLEGTWASDGTVPMTLTIAGTSYKSTANVSGVTVTVTGKAVYDDKAGRMTVSEMKLEAPGAPQQMLDMAASQMPKEVEFSVSWKNNDEVVVSSTAQNAIGGSGTYKRQK